MTTGITGISTLRPGLFLIFIAFILTVLSINPVAAQQDSPYVRIAKIVVDPVQLDSYKVALKEQAEAAVRIEPGVLTLYAVYDKDDPTHITVFEIYAGKAAYESHIQTPHFKKYKATVQNMVTSLVLTDVVPITLKTKPKL